MPVYDVDATPLEAAIQSVLDQTYQNWELCIVDDASTKPHVRLILDRYRSQDPRIHVVCSEQRGHIATASNRAIEAASGEFVVLLDHDDCLTHDALEHIARPIRQNPELDFVYSDEDKLDVHGERVEPFFKPAWSPTLLCSCNYITHIAALRRSLVLQVGGFRDEVVGSQDHDLFLRVNEHARAIAHVPRVLYSWRKSATSTATVSSAKPYAIEAARLTLQETIERRGLDAELKPSHLNGIFFLQHRIPRPARISLIVQGGSDRWLDLLAYQELTLQDVYLAPNSRPTNRARLPAGIRMTDSIDSLTGDYLVWIDASFQPAHAAAILRMLEHARQERVAVVGGVTMDSSHAHILQAGLVVSTDGQPVFAYSGLSTLPSRNFYLNLKDLEREVSAVYSGCCAMRRETWIELGGCRPALPAPLAICDLCLRALERGYDNIYTARAQFRAPRPLSPLPSVDAYEWEWRDYQDPFWNPNMTATSEDGLPFLCPTGYQPRVRHGSVAMVNRA